MKFETNSPGNAPTSKRPLCQRLYFEAHLTDLVRLLGHQGLPLPDAQAQFALLLLKYGDGKMRAAAEEITAIDHTQQPPVARLTDQARKLAFQILGFPPTSEVQQPPPGKDQVHEPSTQVVIGPAAAAQLANQQP